MNVSLPDADLGPLAVLSQQFAEVVRQWGVLSNRQANIVARFERHLAELTSAGTRIEQDAAARVRDLQDTIQREWKELRDAHEEPARELREHASNLTQVCIATADAAQRSWERSEQRLASIESELGRRLADLSREVQAAVTELRTRSPQWDAAGAPAAPWALDTVTRLHEELRGVTGGEESGLVAARRAMPPAPAPAASLRPETASVLSERLESLARDIEDRETRVHDSMGRTTRAWRWAVVALLVVTVLTAALAWRSRAEVRGATARIADAQRDALAAREEAARQMEAVRTDTAREVQQANDNALRAQIIGDVMAAPDLVRYSLIGRDSLAGASAQLRWSRTRGAVFSGLRIVSPPPKTTYQIWLVGRDESVSVGTFSPERGGAATVTSGPAILPRPITGAIVTLEPEGGSRQPTGEIVFARPLPPPAPPS